ncbi:MAG: hypothetical protein AAF902_02390 [Chloroflexota bacterium]
MAQRKQMKYGTLLYKDVFVYEEAAYQKMPDGRAYDPENKKFVNLNPHTVVDFVGVGIWPTTHPAQSDQFKET